MTIDELNLQPVAERGARALLARHPSVIFTSGRRTVAEQASAMASNIVASGRRRWIEETYAASPPRNRLQAWVNAHPEAKTRAALAAGLRSVMAAMSDNELRRISKHLAGLAFDISPVAGSGGDAIKRTMAALPGVTKFLEREGGLVRWHVQF